MEAVRRLVGAEADVDKTTVHLGTDRLSDKSCVSEP